MNLTVVDVAEDELFSEADFRGLAGIEKLSLLALPSKEPLDGSVYRSLPPETTHLITRLVDRLGVRELDVLSNLQYVGLAFAGWWDKYFDTSALKRAKVAVSNNPHYAPNAVVEAILACVLFEYRDLSSISLGPLHQSTPVGRELRGRRFGVIGRGNIGRLVAATAEALGMDVVTFSRRDAQDNARSDLIASSDIIGLFVPKSAGPVLLREDFSLMKRDTIIVNASGHENIEVSGLEAFLRAHSSARYVYLAMPEDCHFDKLKVLSNAKLYPLFAGNTLEARQRRKDFTLLALRQYLQDGETSYRVI